MKTKTSHLGFFLATLLGLSLGLRLASQVGRTGENQGGQASAVLVDASLESASRLSNGSSLSAPEIPAAGDRRRPGPDRHDPRFGPYDGETCVAFGIESADGSPLPGARTALFAVDDERPRFPADAESQADPSGIVYARTQVTGDVLVVAFAPGFQPLARRAMIAASESLELTPFVLQRGATIRGRVTAGNAALPRAEIEATTDTTGDIVKLDGNLLAWRLGHFVWAQVSADTDSDGTYALGGLEAGEHSVRIRAVRQRDVAIDVSKVQPAHATAPAQDVDFELPAARLELAFKASTAALCCVEVQIEAGDRQFTRTTDENGRLTMMIQPALAYPVTAARGGYATVHTQLRGLIDGERSAHTIELVPQKALATLVVDDRDASGWNEAAFAFHSRFPSSGSDDFERTVVRDGISGRFSIPAVPSGPWRVTMRSGRVLGSTTTDRQRMPALLHANCDADVVVDMPDSGTVTATLSTIPRGYARIVAHDARGTPLEARGRLFDLRGAEIDVISMAASEHEGYTRTGLQEPEGSTRIYSTLCGGPADLVVFHDGFENAKVRVVFQPGQVTPVDVVLRPN